MVVTLTLTTLYHSYKTTSCYGLEINLHRFDTSASALEAEVGGRLSLRIICPFQPFKVRSCILDIFTRLTGVAVWGNRDSYKKGI